MINVYTLQLSYSQKDIGNNPEMQSKSTNNVDDILF
jgi:hypothetical protein